MLYALFVHIWMYVSILLVSLLHSQEMMLQICSADGALMVEIYTVAPIAAIHSVTNV